MADRRLSIARRFQRDRRVRRGAKYARRSHFSAFLGWKWGFGEKTKPIEANFRAGWARGGGFRIIETGGRYNPLGGTYQSPFSRQSMQNKANVRRFRARNEGWLGKRSQFVRPVRPWETRLRIMPNDADTAPLRRARPERSRTGRGPENARDCLDSRLRGNDKGGGLCVGMTTRVAIQGGLDYAQRSKEPTERNVQNKANCGCFQAKNEEAVEKQSQSKPICSAGAAAIADSDPFDCAGATGRRSGKHLHLHHGEAGAEVLDALFDVGLQRLVEAVVPGVLDLDFCQDAAEEAGDLFHLGRGHAVASDDRGAQPHAAGDEPDLMFF